MLAARRADIVLILQSLTLGPQALGHHGHIEGQQRPHRGVEFLGRSRPHLVRCQALVAGDKGLANREAGHIHRFRVFRLSRLGLLFS